MIVLTIEKLLLYLLENHVKVASKTKLHGGTSISKQWKATLLIFILVITINTPAVAAVLILLKSVVEEGIFSSTSEGRSITCINSALIIQLNTAVTTEKLAAISFDQFLSIIKPHLHKRFMRPWVALTLTIAIWILCILLLMLPLFGFAEYS
uniref:G-protein coupled receptors family 1 profile domain-containing protein n=1 Tax=Amphimedon queenslandica TaxID=400682 RepID=A0A1X7TA80_AMPQE